MLRVWKQIAIMATFLLTLVRHGETAENKLKIVQGHTDTKLIDIGVKQAMLVGRRLETETFSHVFSSDLCRASETCEIIMKHNRANSTSITLDSRLRERKLGVLEGRPQSNCYDAIKTNAKNLLPGMETKTEVRERAKSFFRELCRTICKESLDLTNSRTSMMNNFQCPFCKSRNCKCCPRFSTATTSGPLRNPQDLLCNPSNSSRKSKHLKNGASQALENLPGRTSMESSSDEEHLGITPDMLQLGRHQHPALSRSKDFPSDAEDCSSSALIKNLWDGYGFREAHEALSHEEESSGPVSHEAGRGGDDDNDKDQQGQLANVLLVSHGGFLMELVNYFFKELKCKRPHHPSTEAAVSTQTTHVELPRQGIMSNAGVSRFDISIDTRSAKATTMTCLYLNDRKHLLAEGEEEEEEEGDSVAGGDLVC